MSVVLSHPTGNANVRAVLRAISEAGRLDSFWTTLAVPARLVDGSVNGSRLGRQLGRRSFPEVPSSRLRSRPGREALRLAARTLRLEGLVRHETGLASVDAVYHDLDRRVARYLGDRESRDARAVYAYEDGGLETFRAAGPRGVRRFYDLPIAHWRTLRAVLAQECELYPAWASTMEGVRDSPAKLARKDEEIRLADRIVVASSFTRQSLEAHFGAELDITVTPYGAPPPRRDRPAERGAGQPLRVLYAGHLSQRKGLAYLIRALKHTDVPWTLTLAGPALGAMPAELRDLLADPRCTWLGHVPHATLLEHMGRAHVLVLPSLIEGFGLVLLEAMSAGLPVITTPNTAGPDIMEDGREGFLVAIRDPEAIAERLHRLHADEALRQSMAMAALRRAGQASWRHYEDMIGNLVSEALR